ncbi:HAMP domain-containing protein [Halopseudomonas laoshanensis]|uniref:histidine kinase n=1 Tax=Halopseudomonas laoshanensis TaxID=2268758 RepID=A0A7V7KY95_9GAMM|nr:sensor histidine kinase [Halopseudomonas laoshanensis]KAA0695876.1 HAMP domain-containing protein [Halopseudomonas laoshanensis]WOD10335.1 ATP-binding protein [Pseudomonas sp. NyZ704]
MSLRLRLTLTLGSTFIILWSLAAAWMLYDLRAEMMRSLDQRLAASAQMVAGLLVQIPQSSQPETAERITAQRLGMPDGLTCQVSSLRGEVIARSNPELAEPLDAQQIGFRDQQIDGVHWRSYTVEQHGMRITTADRLDERQTLQSSVLLAAALPVGVALLGTLLLLWLGVRKGLEPLRRMADAVLQRGPDSLEPLQLSPLPSELQPLQNSQNQLFERIAHAIERERRFTGDAAHELRSPLTAIKVHLQVAGMTTGAESAHALVQAEKGADRLQSTLEQLLLLARVEGRQSFEEGAQATALEVARLAIQDVPDAKERVELCSTGELSPRVLNIPPALATMALRNLLDNALRHTLEGTKVELEVNCQGDWASFKVRDHGPGLADESMMMLTRRFWRQGAGSGSGLGLAIVDAIVQRSGGQLRFSNCSDGMLVTLELPLRP